MKAKTEKYFLKKYIIAFYFVVTFFITMVLGAAYMFTNNPLISPQYAPLIGLLVICWLLNDWSVWMKMNWNSVKTQKLMVWMFVSFFLPLAIIFISSLIMTSIGTPFIIWKDTTLGYVITIITATLGCITEEVGWRGYFLPLFTKNHTMFFSGIVVGLFWGIWHFKFAYGIWGFILFVMLIICFSIFMTWIFMKTNGNLICMILFHFGINIGSVTLLQRREGTLFYSIATTLCVLLCIPIVLKNKTEFFNKKSS